MGGRGASSGTGSGVGMTSAQRATVLKAEKRIRDYKNEQMYVVDADGNVLLHKKGDQGSVTYRVSEARDNFYGATLTHNHPHEDDRGGVSGTFSVADVEAFRYGLKEMRATGAEGTYVLKNLNQGDYKKDKSMEFFNAYNTFMLNDDSGSLKELRSAQEKAGKTSVGQRRKSLMDKASKEFSAGNREKAISLYDESRKLDKEYKFEVQKALYQSSNSRWSGWLKKNAKDYGFSYTIEKRQ